jgi:hypothetical protein
METVMDAPRVFISYSHDSPEHRAWVLRLAKDLRENGVDALLDQWDLALGQDLVSFMHKGIAESDRVLLVCSEKYVAKSVSGLGGVGYERLIVTADVAQDIDTKKFIPVVRDNNSKIKVPGFLGPRLYIDFSDDAAYKIRLEELLRELLGRPVVAKPPLGKSPFSSHAPALAEPVPEGDPVANSLVHGCLLVREALREAHVGSSAGGPTTHNYRRLDLAERWCTQALRLIQDAPNDSFQDYVVSTANRVRSLVSKARAYLPEAGALWTEAPKNQAFVDLHDEIKHDDYFFDEWVKKQGLAQGLDDISKWQVLGFRDEADFRTYLNPTIHQLMQGHEAMTEDLARRLVTNAEFTPRVLWSEGYTKALVMDMVNALIGETWAVWTDLSVSGADGKGKITPVGQRLLARLIDEGSTTQP